MKPYSRSCKCFFLFCRCVISELISSSQVTVANVGFLSLSSAECMLEGLNLPPIWEINENEGINFVDVEHWQGVIMVSEMVPCFISVNLNDMLCPLAVPTL